VSYNTFDVSYFFAPHPHRLVNSSSRILRHNHVTTIIILHAPNTVVYTTVLCTVVADLLQPVSHIIHGRLQEVRQALFVVRTLSRIRRQRLGNRSKQGMR
jgi:hypothetical protein